MYSEKTSDDGQRNCPKHAEFHSKNKFEKLAHPVGLLQEKYMVSIYVFFLMLQFHSTARSTAHALPMVNADMFSCTQNVACIRNIACVLSISTVVSSDKSSLTCP